MKGRNPCGQKDEASKIRLILTDLDGTLLRDDKTVSRLSEETLCAAQEAGILVGLATSRGLPAAAQYARAVNPDVLIASGGAYAAVRGNPVYSCEFSASEAQEVFRAAREVCGGGVEMTAESDGAMFWNRLEDARSQKYANATFDDFLFFNSPLMKICVQTDDEKKAERISRCLGQGAVSFMKFSDIPWHSFSKPGATKEAALKAVCANLGISARQVVAFGDDFSDIGMICECGRGVAMANAIPEVRARACETTEFTNNDDGVARWISSRILCRGMQ